MSDVEVFRTVATILFGGVAGAAVTAGVNHFREQREHTVKLIEKFFDNYRELGEVRWLLEKNQKDDLDDHQKNKVRLMVDWMNFFAICVTRGMVDDDLLNDVEVRSFAADFYNLVAGSLLYKDDKESLSRLRHLKKFGSMSACSCC